jgi:hypothetical protein
MMMLMERRRGVIAMMLEYTLKNKKCKQSSTTNCVLLQIKYKKTMKSTKKIFVGF